LNVSTQHVIYDYEIVNVIYFVISIFFTICWIKTSVRKDFTQLSLKSL